MSREAERLRLLCDLEKRDYVFLSLAHKSDRNAVGNALAPPFFKKKLIKKIYFFKYFFYFF